MISVLNEFVKESCLGEVIVDIENRMLILGRGLVVYGMMGLEW